MTLNRRQKRSVEGAMAIINHPKTSETEAEAALHGIRRIMAATGMTLVQVMAEVADGRAEATAEAEALDDMRRERDRYKTLYEGAVSAAAERMEPANEARSMAADEFAEGVGQVIRAIRQGHRYMSIDAIAEELTRRGIRTRQGNRVWSRMQVHRVMQRLEM